MSDYLEMGRRMELRRKELGLRLSDVAQRIGVAPSTIQRYEKGNFQKVKQPVIDAIAEAFRSVPAGFAEKRKSPTPPPFRRAPSKPPSSAVPTPPSPPPSGMSSGAMPNVTSAL